MLTASPPLSLNVSTFTQEKNLMHTFSKLTDASQDNDDLLRFGHYCKEFHIFLYRAVTSVSI